MWIWATTPPTDNMQYSGIVCVYVCACVYMCVCACVQYVSEHYHIKSSHTPTPPPTAKGKWPSAEHLLSPHRLLFYDRQEGIFYIHHPIDRILYTMAFVTPVVEHCLEKEIA